MAPPLLAPRVGCTLCLWVRGNECGLVGSYCGFATSAICRECGLPFARFVGRQGSCLRATTVTCRGSYENPTGPVAALPERVRPRGACGSNCPTARRRGQTAYHPSETP